jgi:threonyl-tRNA synthetase
MLVVGDKETEGEKVAVRSHAEGELGEMTVPEFAARIAADTGAS